MKKAIHCRWMIHEIFFSIVAFKNLSAVNIFWKRNQSWEIFFMYTNVFLFFSFRSLQMSLIQVTSPKDSLNNHKMMDASAMQLMSSH